MLHQRFRNKSETMTFDASRPRTVCKIIFPDISELFQCQIGSMTRSHAFPASIDIKPKTDFPALLFSESFCHSGNFICASESVSRVSFSNFPSASHSSTSFMLSCVSLYPRRDKIIKQRWLLILIVSATPFEKFYYTEKLARSLQWCMLALR